MQLKWTPLIWYLALQIDPQNAEVVVIGTHELNQLTQLTSDNQGEIDCFGYYDMMPVDRTMAFRLS